MNPQPLDLSPSHGQSGAGTIRLGTVPYLNVQPLIWAIQNHHLSSVPLSQKRPPVTIHSEVPRRLAENLAHGIYDTAIVPVFEYFRHPDAYSYIPGPAIAAQTSVDSVMLFSADKLDELHTIYLDVSSLTSVHLFKVIAAELGLELKYLDTAVHPVPRPLPSGTGWVVIGDPALAEHNRHPHALDLATAWHDLTGLHFVFAAWLVPAHVYQPNLPTLLQGSLAIGLENLPRIAEETATQFGVTPDFALKYFKNSIHYHLGKKELAGWEAFGRLCFKHGLISQPPKLRPFRAE